MDEQVHRQQCRIVPTAENSLGTSPNPITIRWCAILMFTVSVVVMPSSSVLGVWFTVHFPLYWGCGLQNTSALYWVWFTVHFPSVLGVVYCTVLWGCGLQYTSPPYWGCGLQHTSRLCTQRIDMERASREALDPALRHKPRLITVDELPAWLLKDVEEVRPHRPHDFQPVQHVHTLPHGHCLAGGPDDL